MQTRYFCPCCGYNTLSEKPPGTYDICPICYWEDDPIQFENPNYEGGANQVSLKQGQINYLTFGACENEMIRYVIKPDSTYLRNPHWKLI